MIEKFGAKVKGKAATCGFYKTVPANPNVHKVDFPKEITKIVVVSGIADHDIKKEILGKKGLEALTLQEVIGKIASLELAAWSLGESATQPPQQATISSFKKITKDDAKLAL